MEKIINDFNSYEYFKEIAYNNNNLLFSAEIDVTARCNANCIFCFQGNIHNEKGNLTLSDYKTLLNDLREMGVYNLGFSGGEPFCREDFLDILDYSKKLGFRVSFITNGQLMKFSDIDKLYKINVDRVTISFHSLNRSTYNSIFGINKETSYNRVLSNIKYILDKNIPIGIAVTVTKYNIDELEHIKNFFINLGVQEKYINFNMLLTGAKNIEKLRPTIEQIERNKYLLNYNKKNSNGFLCSAGRISCSIDSRGNIYPCTFFNFSAGNIKDNSIKHIWNNSHLFKIIRSINSKHFDKCNSCKNRLKCNVCLVTNINETGNIFIPSEEYCNSKEGKIINE
ncbi:radical SAM protein [Helcococcus ovis]|uniref:radical SAM/SPASM domain-containing protein n=1 Tax=Helcococcus ovis TaxID=72026 RepID=UPI00106F8AEB|nr:radical SAM protein [Helcococcus ovis]TFF68691.1 radical SAM protein [Helcococcus ovis]WNZ01632.1 radical SAM protein [Helcococcus ovis]